MDKKLPQNESITQREIPYGPDHPSYIAPLSPDIVELLRGQEFDGMFKIKKNSYNTPCTESNRPGSTCE